MATTRKQRWLYRIGALFVIIVGLVWWNYSNIINLVIPEKHRPGKIEFAVQKVSDSEFEQLARQLETDYGTYASVDTAVQNPGVYSAVARQLAGNVKSFGKKIGLSHVDRFRKAGIREYRGPETCLRCHY
jgi:hypothetical protein